ncbi:hypothetical protein [uncultured Sphingomonas sp.]|uniref:hypothetical protein n=1 Tax=uncultured Sphingomonas sp. TaxID=158754 RepID=UPI0025E1E519|nr:hypothetical protein [uncultured Sphingomonas sp.]
MNNAHGGMDGRAGSVGYRRDGNRAREVRVAGLQSRTLSTSLTYDAEQNMLAVTCAVSSDGLCRMTIVDGGRRKLLSMRPASRVVVRGVSRGARVCALGRSGGLCDWRAVSA